VLENEALTTAVLPCCQKEICEWCLADTARMRCGKCKTARYCGKACQVKSWRSRHKEECKIFKDLKAFREQHTVHMAWRLLTNKLTRSGWLLLEGMCHHIEKQRPNIDRQVINAISTCLEDSSGASEDRILRILCQFDCNNFEIWDSQLNSRAVGVYPIGSLLNHSCVPNTVAGYRGTTQVFRALELISKGEELVHCYCDPITAYSSRQEKLLSKYCFQCKCSLCGESRDPNSKYTQTTAKLDSERSLLKNALNRLVALRERSVVSVAEDSSPGELEDVLSILGKYLGRFNIQRVVINSLVVDVSIMRNDLSTAISAAESCLEVYREIYPTYHPMIAIELLTLAKLYWNYSRGIADSRKSKELLLEARSALTKSWGEDDVLVKDADKLLEDIDVELGIS